MFEGVLLQKSPDFVACWEIEGVYWGSYQPKFLITNLALEVPGALFKTAVLLRLVKVTLYPKPYVAFCSYPAKPKTTLGITLT